jgi:hypothetical protein
MAKRRKEKDEEEEKPFKIPKFDEEAFLKREKRNIKATIISFLFGILMALICFGFWALMGKNDLRWPLVLLVAVANAAFLKIIFTRVNIDLTDFGRKNWFGSYAIYFITWLIVFIVLVNPPFYDDEAPRIEVSVLPVVQEPGGDIMIVSKMTDNLGIDKNSISLEIVDPDENVTILTPSSFDQGDIIVIFTFENNENQIGDFSYTLKAQDINGLKTTKTGSFYYYDDAIDITSSRFENISSGDDITIEVDEEVSPKNFRVYYTLNNGDEINVNRKYKEVKAEYETSPEYEGWNQNSNYTMRVYVEVSYYFTNIFEKYSNIVEDTTKYHFTTSIGSNIGEDTPPLPWNWSKPFDKQAPVLLNYDDYDSDKPVNTQILLPRPTSVSAPGFETVLFLLSIIAIVLIFKYKKKNRSKKK